MTRQRGHSEPRGKTSVVVKNLGGIDETAVTFGPGTTVLSGRNATNRSSFLRSIMAALGSDRPVLKADADHGRVELTLNGETYTRSFERTEHGIVKDGNPFLADASDADLFAFLLEDNTARLAVERGDDLREVMLRPVDTAGIEAEIERLHNERQAIQEQLRELDGLRQSRRALAEEREDVVERREMIAEQLDTLEAPEALDASREHQAALEDVLADLREERAALDDATFELETARESREELIEELAAITADIDAEEDISEERLDMLGEQIDTLRTTRSALETEINQLGTVSEFNKDMLERHAGLFDDVNQQTPTDALVEEDDAVTCWTCGTSVDAAAIETAVEHLEARRQQKVTEHADITDELDTLREKRAELQERRTNREERERERVAIQQEIETHEQRIAGLEDVCQDRRERIEELEEAVTELEQDDYDEILARQRDINEKEFELRRLEHEHERLTTNIDELDAQLEREDDLTARDDAIGEELRELRTRVERIEETAIEAFNEHMAELLDVLEYENIERVWIERRTVDAAGRGEKRTVFDHHVVRSAADGTTYEDSVQHLSESEREVIGLVFALAGYLVHELHERVPFVLLDSLEVIDSNRIATIVEYFEEYAEYLVVALLPEDAAAIDSDVERVTDLTS